MIENKPPLTFEEFSERVPMSEHTKGLTFRYNNFPYFFITQGVVNQWLREQEFFQRFQKEHSDLERKLRDGIMNRDKSIDELESFKPLEKDLYKAYLIMRSYGASDDDLFA